MRVCRRAIVIPDQHFPIHDKKAVNVALQIIEIVKPDTFINLGDVGEWSMKEGVLSELIALGANKSYPNFSVLTKSEAQVLAGSSTFVVEE